jgi:capsular exopolysaccharide synthesis family protein
MSAEGRIERFDRTAEPRFPAGVPSRAGGSHEILPASVAEPLVSLNAPTTVAADQYRALRHNLESLRESSSPYVLAITSPSPGDGKTVTTLNLAGTLAEKDDARILVIDADLRRASVAAYLGLPGHPTPGLADALRDPRIDLSHIVRRVRGVNLWIALAGTPGSAPHELLTSPRFGALLDDARREFSGVLIDTPPCVLMPDCRLIERLVDGFLLVIAAHKTPRRLVAEALRELPRTKTLGVVFNADDRASSSYYGYSGGYYDDDSARRSPRGAWWKRMLGV